MPINRDYAQFLSSFHSDKFRSLRDAQDYVLREYATGYVSCLDVAIELPTGAGKTPIALLIAEAWRQEGKKVAILSANKTLARQMLAEANALGIPAVLMEGRGVDIPAPDKRAYQRAAKVAIMNYWVYFNQNPVIDPADLLVMDDAHLAEHCLHSLYSVEIKRQSHENLFNALITELQARFPEYSVLADAIAGDVPPTSATELLSFIDQVESADRIREIIDVSPFLGTDRDLGFRWERIRGSLREANIYLSLHSIWIRPYVYPLLSNFHYAQTQQRIYMSATVGDPGDLSRRLGVRPITKIPVSPEYAEKTSGRRLVVMNRIEDQDFPQRLQVIILASLQIHPKSVWLCSSEAQARKFQEVVSTWLNLNGLVGHPTWLLTPLGDEIDHFKASPNGHLFVAGRFDGMDFKADECRLVILTTLPRAINAQEEFISSYLRDSGFMLRRLNQRIVQALGRCNRSDDDFGVYVLVDRRFATHFGRESSKEGLPRNIVAEIDMAQDSAEIEVDVLVRRVENFLRGDFSEYDRDIQAYLGDVPMRTAQAQLPDTSEDEVIGWASLFASQNYEIAADRFERCWDTARSANLLEIGALYGWQWAKALYLQSLRGEPSARDRALMVFESAIRRGGSSSWFNRMRASLNRARQAPVVSQEMARDDYGSHLIQAFDDILERQGVTGNRFDRWCDSITNLLQSDSHAQYQEGLEKLGQALSYSASRPRYDTATDCRWRGVFGNSKEVVTFEAKIEHSFSQELSAHDVGQAHNQLARALAEQEPHGYTVRGTIVTHLTALARDAEASAGPIKILVKPAILALWERVRLVLSLYRDDWSLHDISARMAAAQAIRARLPDTGWFIRAIDVDVRFITAEHILAGWPQS
jgi:hypothetical protein